MSPAELTCSSGLEAMGVVEDAEKKEEAGRSFFLVEGGAVSGTSRMGVREVSDGLKMLKDLRRLRSDIAYTKVGMKAISSVRIAIVSGTVAGRCLRTRRGGQKCGSTGGLRGIHVGLN